MGVGRGCFITFEGTEGCGKSTQIALLRERLEAAGVSSLVLREPGGTALGEAIRHLLQFAPEGEEMVPEAELLLFAASRAQLVRERIAPALEAGRAVVADRFLDSTTVYQGVARGLDPEAVAGINAFAVGGCRPDVTFLIDVEPGEGRRRLAGRAGGEDRIERQGAAFFERVRAGYLELARREPGRIVVLDGTRAAEHLADSVAATLNERFDGILG